LAIVPGSKARGGEEKPEAYSETATRKQMDKKATPPGGRPISRSQTTSAQVDAASKRINSKAAQRIPPRRESSRDET